jgi:hypothetical protein
MLTSFKSAEVACKDCTVVEASGDLEYTNGTKANVDTGMWFHHAAWFNMAKSRKLLGCEFPFDKKVAPDPFYATGSERTTIQYDGTVGSGYYIRPRDSFRILSEMMNIDNEDKEVYITMETEYIEGPPKQLEAQNLYMTVRPCSPSGFNPTAPTYVGKNWTAPFDGYFLSMSGHLHDGGDTVRFFVNNKLVCDSNATYGGGHFEHQANGQNWSTISQTKKCDLSLPMKKGDTIYLEADYGNSHIIDQGKDAEKKLMGMGIVTLAMPIGAELKQ